MDIENEMHESGTSSPVVAADELLASPLIVVPELKRRRRRYKAKDVERALREIAHQVEDFERLQTQRLMSSLATLVLSAQKDAENTSARASAEAADILAKAHAEAEAMVAAAREEMRVLTERMAQIRKLANELIRQDPDPQ